MNGTKLHNLQWNTWFKAHVVVYFDQRSSIWRETWNVARKTPFCLIWAHQLPCCGPDGDELRLFTASYTHRSRWWPATSLYSILHTPVQMVTSYVSLQYLTHTGPDGDQLRLFTASYTHRSRWWPATSLYRILHTPVQMVTSYVSLWHLTHTGPDGDQLRLFTASYTHRSRWWPAMSLYGILHTPVQMVTSYISLQHLTHTGPDGDQLHLFTASYTHRSFPHLAQPLFWQLLTINTLHVYCHTSVLAILSCSAWPVKIKALFLWNVRN